MRYDNLVLSFEKARDRYEAEIRRLLLEAAKAVGDTEAKILANRPPKISKNGVRLGRPPNHVLKIGSGIKLGRPKSKPKTKKRTMSLAARALISKAQKARWAKLNGAKK